MAFKASPFLNDQQFSNNGLLLSGGKIETYLAGSSTPATTYTSITGTVAQSNPIILNTRGEVDNLIHLTTGIKYKLILKDSANNILRTYDNIEGVNDSSLTIDQWVNLGVMPTFVSATQFTLAGDQTSAFHVNRRIKLLVTAGTVYGTITATAFAALTTVTVALDAGALDSGLSSADLGLITFVNSSITAFVPKAGGTYTGPIIVPDQAYNATTWDANIEVPTKNAVRDKFESLVLTSKISSIRQTVAASPIDAAGFPTFIPATSGSLVLTMQNVTSIAPFIATSANGYDINGDVNRAGQVTGNTLSWTVGASVTSYLPITVNADGTLTTVTPVNLLPIYQFSGTPSTTANQYTYNITEAKMYKGNGSTAPQVNDVIVGEAVSGASTITSTIAYALNGHYDSGYTSTLVGIGAAYTKNHNFGTKEISVTETIECITADMGYVAGDTLDNPFGAGASWTAYPTPNKLRNAVVMRRPNTSSYGAFNATTGAQGGLVLANWKYKMTVKRLF